jgi:hypothetical protein
MDPPQGRNCEGWEEFTAEDLIQDLQKTADPAERYQLERHLLDRGASGLIEFATHLEPLWDYIEADKEAWSTRHSSFKQLARQYKDLRDGILSVKRKRNRDQEVRMAIEKWWGKEALDWLDQPTHHVLKAVRKCCTRGISFNDARVMIVKRVLYRVLEPRRGISNSLVPVGSDWEAVAQGSEDNEPIDDEVLAVLGFACVNGRLFRTYPQGKKRAHSDDSDDDDDDSGKPQQKKSLTTPPTSAPPRDQLSRTSTPPSPLRPSTPEPTSSFHLFSEPSSPETSSDEDSEASSSETSSEDENTEAGEVQTTSKEPTTRSPQWSLAFPPSPEAEEDDNGKDDETAKDKDKKDADTIQESGKSQASAESDKTPLPTKKSPAQVPKRVTIRVPKKVSTDTTKKTDSGAAKNPTASKGKQAVVPTVEAESSKDGEKAATPIRVSDRACGCEGPTSRWKTDLSMNDPQANVECAGFCLLSPVIYCDWNLCKGHLTALSQAFGMQTMADDELARRLRIVWGGRTNFKQLVQKHPDWFGSASASSAATATS